MQITIDTSKPLNRNDARILSVLLNVDGTTIDHVVEEPATKRLPTPSDPSYEEPAPTRPGQKTAKILPAPEPEPEPEEDLLGEQKVLTVQDALDRAGVLVSSGKAAAVKKALREAGADRVSGLTPDQIPVFMAALPA